jgi:hypothetical protein
LQKYFPKSLPGPANAVDDRGYIIRAPESGPVAKQRAPFIPGGEGQKMAPYPLK